TWAYRHAVPALDEAYTEARESEDESAASPSINATDDLTRVEQAVAFTFPTAPPGAGVQKDATGWLPKTLANPTGSLKLTVTGAALEPVEPRVVAPFEDGSPLGFGRAGAVAPVALDATFAPGAGGEFPAFEVKRAGAGSGAEQVVRHGQLLIARADAGGRVATL